MGRNTVKVTLLNLFKLAFVTAQQHSVGHCSINPAGTVSNNISRNFFVSSASRGHYFQNSLYSCSCGQKQIITQKMSCQTQEAKNSPEKSYINENGQFVSEEFIPCHMKARCKLYPRETTVERLTITDDQVSWDNDCPGYEDNVTVFTSAGVLKGPVWADTPDPVSQGIQFNVEDMKIDRKSYMGQYKVDNGFPRNPRGRTGLKGRGCLGRWGPNHAGDPIVTRWKRDENNEIVNNPDSGKPILQFVAVQRSDNKEWALPGGMVNPGENKTVALKREFGEEALNSLEASEEEKERIEKEMEKTFVNYETIYRGYVDDPRNTDNAWMETKALNFHDNEGNGVGAFKLNAGDDAIGVQWMDIDKSLNLYASHINFIQKTVEIRGAHW